MRFEKKGRHWAVYDAEGGLVCLAVYRRGAEEVVRRLSAGEKHRHRRRKGGGDGR